MTKPLQICADSARLAKVAFIIYVDEWVRKKNPIRLKKISAFLVMGLEIYLIVKLNHDSCELDRVVKLMYKRGQSHAINRRQNDESIKDLFMYQPY